MERTPVAFATFVADARSLLGTSKDVEGFRSFVAEARAVALRDIERDIEALETVAARASR